MIILSAGFNYVLFDDVTGLNLWTAAWVLDIPMSFIAFISSAIYFKNRFLSLTLFIIMVFSVMVCFFGLFFTKELSPITNSELSSKYAISQIYREYNEIGTYNLSAATYKEIFPFVYVQTDSVSEEVADKTIISNFKGLKYIITDDGKYLTFGGRMKLSLK